MSDKLDDSFYMTCECGYTFNPYALWLDMIATIEEVFNAVQSGYQCPNCKRYGHWSHNC